MSADLKRKLTDAENGNSVLNAQFGEPMDRYEDYLNRRQDMKKAIFTPHCGNAVVDLFRRKMNSDPSSKDGPVIKLIKNYMAKGCDIGLFGDLKSGSKQIGGIATICQDVIDSYISKLLDEKTIKIFRADEQARIDADQELKKLQLQIGELRLDKDAGVTNEIIAREQECARLKKIIDVETKSELYGQVTHLKETMGKVCEVANQLVSQLHSTNPSIYHPDAKGCMDKIVSSALIEKNVNQFKQNLIPQFLKACCKEQFASPKAVKVLGITPAASAEPYIRLNNLVDVTLQILNSYKPDKPLNPHRIAMLEVLAAKLNDICARPGIQPNQAAEELMGTLKAIQQNIEQHESRRNFVTKAYVLHSSHLYQSVNKAITAFPEMKAVEPATIPTVVSDRAQKALAESKIEVKAAVKSEVSEVKEKLFTRVGPR